MAIFSYLTINDLNTLPKLLHNNIIFIKIESRRDYMAIPKEYHKKSLKKHVLYTKSGLALRIDAEKATGRRSLQRLNELAKSLDEKGHIVTLTASARILEKVDINILKKLGIRVLTLTDRVSIRRIIDVAKHDILFEVMLEDLVRELQFNKCNLLKLVEVLEESEALVVSFNGYTPLWHYQENIVKAFSSLNNIDIQNRWWLALW